MINTKRLLMAVVALATLFYLYQLGRADIVTDESSYATRAIGLVDFPIFSTSAQARVVKKLRTPLQFYIERKILLMNR